VKIKSIHHLSDVVFAHTANMHQQKILKLKQQQASSSIFG
jgi:predicted DNA-binding protein (MmcQ/YjbR family)